MCLLCSGYCVAIVVIPILYCAYFLNLIFLNLYSTIFFRLLVLNLNGSMIPIIIFFRLRETYYVITGSILSEMVAVSSDHFIHLLNLSGHISLI